MNYRPANIDDLMQLRTLEQGVIDAERPFDLSIRETGAYYYDIEHLISSDECCLLVAEISGQLIATGFAKIRQSKPSLNHKIDSYLGFMYVLPDYRGQGVNKEIMDRLIAWSRSKGVSELYLDVYSGNLPAINAYIKSGFSSSMIEMKLTI